MKTILANIVEYFKDPLNLGVTFSLIMCGLMLLTYPYCAALWLVIAVLFIANRHSQIYANSMKVFANSWEMQADEVMKTNHKLVLKLNRAEVETDYIKGKITKEAYEEKVKAIDNELAKL